jgi:hypothetical protein
VQSNRRVLSLIQIGHDSGEADHTGTHLAHGFEMGDATLCDKKLRLLVEFREATASFSSRVADMASLTGRIPLDEFALLSRFATEAHKKCMEARDQFYEHLAEHGC